LRRERREAPGTRRAARTAALKPASLISGPPTEAANSDTNDETLPVTSSTLRVMTSTRASCLFASWIVTVDSERIGVMPSLTSLIESRVWSYLWDIDDEAWRAHAVPAVENLRALPEPDRPRRYGQRHRISVFTA